ncbi:cholinesterase 1-like [Oppia nitens]|uniref:cholinesterase 1-like n=1 Tax=Oppia nitens TaxID=1686743 RepID=UPI0023D98D97|nr:cholinesterase 1-like [Oppia nitens]
MYIKNYLQIVIKLICLTNILCDNVVTVNTTHGLINGFTESYNDKRLHVFLGIPYAKPPVKRLRFLKPRPMIPWTKARDAIKWPNNCYQTELLSNNSNKNNNFSEDCLYLNIWTPNTSAVNADDLKSVIIYIHGGALYVGSSSIDIHDGKVLAALGDIVVITLNYRLDAFGFLYADSWEAPGNMGLWDQAMAMEWIYNNIKYFGGDSDRITLMGHNAGGWSVSLHMLSPVSHHLFRNAILMSGAVYNHPIERDAESIKQFWLNAAIEEGCVDDQDYVYLDFTPKILKCLRQLTPQKVLELTQHHGLLTPKLGWHRLVVIDGKFLPNKPINLLKNNRYNSTHNVLIGTVEDEGSLLLNSMIDPNLYDLKKPRNLTVEEAIDELAHKSSFFYSNYQVNGLDVAQVYFHGLSDQTSSHEIISRIGMAFGDFYIVCPTIRFAEMFLLANDNYVNVYQYYFTAYNDSGFCPNWMKACHSLDLINIFGVPLVTPSTQRFKQISQSMIHMVSHFAKLGYPNTNAGDLTAFYKLNNKIVKPYYQFRDQPHPISDFGLGVKTFECEYLWNDYLDAE